METQYHLWETEVLVHTETMTQDNAPPKSVQISLPD